MDERRNRFQSGRTKSSKLVWSKKNKAQQKDDAKATSKETQIIPTIKKNPTLCLFGSEWAENANFQCTLKGGLEQKRHGDCTRWPRARRGFPVLWFFFLFNFAPWQWIRLNGSWKMLASWLTLPWWNVCSTANQILMGCLRVHIARRYCRHRRRFNLLN